MKGNNNRFLVVYSGLLTAVFAVVVLTGATAPGKKAAFEEIDVQRLNLREPDGTLRYVLASSARLPGAIIRGQEYPHPRPQAGMLFYNDEETELGGLVFAGGQDEDGVIRSGGSLTFDRYEQDQIVQLLGLDMDGRQLAGLQVSDRPDHSIVEDFQEHEKLQAMPEEERDALIRQRVEANHYGADRLFVGRNYEGDALLLLHDGRGKARMRLKVEPDGAAAIEFLDEDGEVVRRLTPETLASEQ